MIAAALALFLGAAPRARACPMCGCGDPTITAMGIEKPYQNRVRLGLDERFGGHTSGDPSYAETTWSLRSTLIASWSPIPRLTVEGLLPLVAEWIDVPSQPMRRAVGLGDAEVLVRGVVWRDRAFSPSHLLSVVGGIKTPTGPRAYDADGYPVPDDDQPGSGSWDPEAGASYAYYTERFTAFSSALYRLTTPGRNGYQHGQTVAATAGLQFQGASWIAAALSADFRWAAADTFRGGSDVPNTGGAMLALTPALLLAPTNRWVIRLAVQVHVADWLYGSQSESHAVMLSTAVDLN